MLWGHACKWLTEQELTLTCKGTTQLPVPIGSLFTQKCHLKWNGPHLHSFKKTLAIGHFENSKIDHWILASRDFMHSLVDFKRLIIVKWISSQQKFKYLLFNKHLRNANFSSTEEARRLGGTVVVVLNLGLATWQYTTGRLRCRTRLQY